MQRSDGDSAVGKHCQCPLTAGLSNHRDHRRRFATVVVALDQVVVFVAKEDAHIGVDVVPDDLCIDCFTCDHIKPESLEAIRVTDATAGEPLMAYRRT